MVPASVSVEAEKVKLEPNGADAKLFLEDNRAICVERIDGNGDITVSTHPAMQNGQLCLSNISGLFSVSDQVNCFWKKHFFMSVTSISTQRWGSFMVQQSMRSQHLPLTTVSHYWLENLAMISVITSWMLGGITSKPFKTSAKQTP